MALIGYGSKRSKKLAEGNMVSQRETVNPISLINKMLPVGTTMETPLKMDYKPANRIINPTENDIPIPLNMVPAAPQMRHDAANRQPNFDNMSMYHAILAAKKLNLKEFNWKGRRIAALLKEDVQPSSAASAANPTKTSPQQTAKTVSPAPPAKTPAPVSQPKQPSNGLVNAKVAPRTNQTNSSVRQFKPSQTMETNPVVLHRYSGQPTYRTLTKQEAIELRRKEIEAGRLRPSVNNKPAPKPDNDANTIVRNVINDPDGKYFVKKINKQTQDPIKRADAIHKVLELIIRSQGPGIVESAKDHQEFITLRDKSDKKYGPQGRPYKRLKNPNYNPSLIIEQHNKRLARQKRAKELQNMYGFTYK